MHTHTHAHFTHRCTDLINTYYLLFNFYKVTEPHPIEQKKSAEKPKEKVEKQKEKKEKPKSEKSSGGKGMIISLLANSHV